MNAAQGITEVALLVESLIAADLSDEQAIVLVTSEKVLQSISEEQAQAIFDAVDESTLTEQEGLLIVNAVQDASEEVRSAFEEAINTFDGKTDTYIPVGSVIPISMRRVIVVSTAFMIAVPPVAVRRR